MGAAELCNIDDNAIYTGREVKRLLAEVVRDESPYVKVGEAATITGTKRATLKSAAPRYWQQQQTGERPQIRVRRTSAMKGAHWLFHEGDCWAVRRESGVGVEIMGDGLDEDEATIAHYVHKTTVNL